MKIQRKIRKSYIGDRRGKLVVIEEIFGHSAKEDKVLCKCDCGNFTTIGRLHRSTASCGCLNVEKIKKQGYLNRRYSQSVINNAYNSAKGQAKLRYGGFTFDFEIWKTIVFQPCYYCGTIDKKTLSPYHIQKKKMPFTQEDLERYTTEFNGIDRIDNSKGYTLDNCRPCCGWCNRMKRDNSESDFFERIQKIYNKHKVSFNSDVK